MTENGSSSAEQLVHPGADKACPLCHGRGLRVVPDGAFAVARLCTCIEGCPVCRDTGWVATGEGFRAPRRRCQCQHVAHRARVFDEVRIPRRYAHATLESFTPSRANMPAFIAVNRFITEFDPQSDNRGLVLHGQVGRGKTHLLVGMLRELVLRYGVSARFVEFSHLLADLKMSFDRRSGAAEILGPLSRVRVLAIDELGKGRNTEFEGTVLDELVSRRYNAAATILGTTNYEPRPATGRKAANLARAHHEQPTLADRVSERVFSRLREMCDFVPLEGEDHRETARRRGRRRGT